MSSARIVRDAPYNAEIAPRALQCAITPTEDFYVRNNFAAPEISPSDHRIAVDGAVRTPLEISLGQLRAMPSRSVVFTMECAGNDRTGMRPLPEGEPWKSGAIGTARWTGVPLRDVLDQASALPGTIEVVVEGADRGLKDGISKPMSFCRSLPLDEVGGDVLLAYEMNAEPLPTRHGAPVRLVVPGWYGMASVKWVARISVLESPFTGYFQTTRYVYAYEDSVVPVTRALVKSMIVSPCEGDVLNGRDILVKGLAWSGSGAITRVMVSEQASADWKEAALGSPASQYAWTPWECLLTVESFGRYVLRSRAEDASGNVQPESIRWNRLGYGNNATQPVIVQVTAP